jgi:hypothetical protein
MATEKQQMAHELAEAELDLMRRKEAVTLEK